MSIASDLRVGKINKIHKVVSERNIHDDVNKFLDTISGLYDLKVEDISYRLISENKNQMYDTAVIRYSYVGVIDDTYEMIKNNLSRYPIQFSETTMLQRRDDPIETRRELVKELDNGYQVKKGDIIIV